MTVSMKVVIALAVLVVPIGAAIHAIAIRSVSSSNRHTKLPQPRRSRNRRQQQ